MTVNNDISTELVSTTRYVVRLAETEADLRNAQSLRYKVFNLELGEGLADSHKGQLDIDKYDFQCDHLLVVEKDTKNVIGTYRMQTYESASKYHGFYTAEEFEVENLPKELLNESVEVGRACIHKEHRNGRVLYLLWRGIAEYMKITESRYLFGCCSISTTDPEQGWIVMDYLQNEHLLHEEHHLDTKPEFKCPEVDYDTKAWQNVTLPELFRLYIDLDAKILSEPALDKEFKTIDYLTLVDIMQLDERTKALFLK